MSKPLGLMGQTVRLWRWSRRRPTLRLGAIVAATVSTFIAALWLPFVTIPAIPPSWDRPTAALTLGTLIISVFLLASAWGRAMFRCMESEKIVTTPLTETQHGTPEDPDSPFDAVVILLSIGGVIALLMFLFFGAVLLNSVLTGIGD